MSAPTDRPANRLANETSPYLLQHAHNPVDWYPWGEEAIAKARAEDRPIFLSVGYSACHWCHVMERESFENEAIARLLNENFVAIKVDREERPDIDQIYMAAVQAMTRQGGWPMSVFLSPDLQPFYGGTYFPPTDRRGMPGFDRILRSVANAWRDRRQELLTAAAQMTQELAGLGQVPPATDELDHRLLDNAARSLAQAFEPRYGGFGSAPKFPHPMDLMVLLRHYARTGDIHALHMVRHTLDSMARGGIYDHLGGGFARYATDDRWLVPHFEKMLYDNALLARVYLESFQVTHNAEDARVARETMDYVLRRLISPEGGFYSTEDADSEGEEGKYYVWSQEEIEQVLGPDREKTFSEVHDVTPVGNWEGHNILNLPQSLETVAQKRKLDLGELRTELAESRTRLLEVREHRVPPGMDTKILASWNGLMISALAYAGPVLDEPRYLDAARRAAAFVLERMRQPDGRLWHAHTGGQAKFNGYVDDYACVIDGLTRLFEATGEPRWILAAVELADILIDQFADAQGGGFFYTGKDHEELIVRQKDWLDSATPSGNAMATTAFLRLGAITGRESYTSAGQAALRAVSSVLLHYPTAVGQSLIALDLLLAPAQEITIVPGDDPTESRTIRNVVAGRFLPRAVVVSAADPSSSTELIAVVPMLAERPAVAGLTTVYLCENHVCGLPLAGAEAVETGLTRLR